MTCGSLCRRGWRVLWLMVAVGWRVDYRDLALPCVNLCARWPGRCWIRNSFSSVLRISDIEGAQSVTIPVMTGFLTYDGMGCRSIHSGQLWLCKFTGRTIDAIESLSITSFAYWKNTWAIWLCTMPISVRANTAYNAGNFHATSFSLIAAGIILRCRISYLGGYAKESCGGFELSLMKYLRDGQGNSYNIRLVQSLVVLIGKWHVLHGKRQTSHEKLKLDWKNIILTRHNLIMHHLYISIIPFLKSDITTML
jgi:hypothetical protein